MVASNRNIAGPITTIGRRSQVDLKGRFVIVGAEVGYTVRETSDYFEAVYDRLRAEVLGQHLNGGWSPLRPAKLDESMEDVFNRPDPALGPDGAEAVAGRANPGLVSLSPASADPNFLAIYDFTDVGIGGVAAPVVSSSLPVINRATFGPSSLEDLTQLDSVATDIEANVTALITTLLDYWHEAGEALASALFLHNERLRPPVDIVTAESLVEAAVRRSAVPSTYRALVTDVLVAAAVRMGRVTDPPPIQVVGGLGAHLLRPTVHLAPLYVERSLDSIDFPSQSLDTRALGGPAGRGHITAYIKTVFDAIREPLKHLRQRIHYLPRVLECHTFSVFHSARDIDIFDWAEFDGVVNMFPRPVYVLPPTPIELKLLGPEVAYLAEVLQSGSSRTKLTRLSAEAYLSHWRVIEERAAKDDRRPFAFVSIEPNYRTVGRLTSVYDVAATGARGYTSLTAFGRLGHEEVLTYETLVSKFQSQLRSFIDLCSSAAAGLGPTSELLFGGDAYAMFVYAVCAADALLLRVDVAATAQVTPGWVGGAGIELTFRATAREDAPHRMLGVRLTSEVTRSFETENGATVAVLSAKRPGPGHAAADIAVRDDVVSTIAERPRSFFHTTVNVPGLSLTNPVAPAFVTTASLITGAGPDGVAAGVLTSTSVTPEIADIARLPRHSGVRLLLHRGLPLELYAAGFRLSRIAARWSATPGVTSTFFGSLAAGTAVRGMVYDTTLQAAHSIAARRARVYEIAPLTLDEHILFFHAKAASLQGLGNALFFHISGYRVALMLARLATLDPIVARVVPEGVYLGVVNADPGQ